MSSPCRLTSSQAVCGDTAVFFVLCLLLAYIGKQELTLDVDEKEKMEQNKDPEPQ